jgi:hypothetical protein
VPVADLPPRPGTLTLEVLHDASLSSASGLARDPPGGSVIARLVGLAVDARAAARRVDPAARALAARWIAGNLLAIRGLRVGLDGELPAGARVLGLHAATLTGVLAALAAVPALVDAATLPVRWRLALAALGIPVVDRPLAAVLAGGASVVRPAPRIACALAVDPEAHGYRVRVAEPGRMLAA